ncbi:unnamed protein product [Gordionus sp. m RMFG-2023]
MPKSQISHDNPISKIIANEPSLALFRISEHIRRSLPQLTHSKIQIENNQDKLLGKIYDIDTSISVLQDMEKVKPLFKKDLSEVSYVCTTADCWSGHRRAFIGLTAHWLDPLTLKRRQEECFFVKEYATVMEPLAISLKILEQEDNMEQEYLTPVLPILIDKLTKFSCLRYCQPLVDSVLRGIDKRFPSLYEDRPTPDINSPADTFN